MRIARERTSKKKPVEPSVIVETQLEPEQAPSAEEARRLRRERRAARRAREAELEAETTPTPPMEQVEMSPWVPIVWFVVPLVLAIVWSLVDAWLHP